MSNEEEQPEKKRSLEEIFNVPAPEPKPTTDVTIYDAEIVENTDIVEVQDEVDQDFSESREKLKKIAEIADGAIEDLADIAKQSEQPRSYDALSKMIGAAVLANKAVLEVHKNRKDVKDDDGSGGPTTINNNLYMTTAEFAKRLEQYENGEGEEDEG